MENRYKLIGGSLVGAIAIHAAFVACGHSLSARGDADGGTEAGLLDALVDHVSGLLDGTTKDAKAEVDGGGTCGCTTVSGSVQSVPASENPTQLKLGNLTGLTAAGTLVATGPFVLADASAQTALPGTGAGASLIVQPAAATCPTLSGPADATPGYVVSVLTDPPTIVAIHGGRYAIPAGQMLCAYAISAGNLEGQLQWAGFTPYP